MENENPCVLDNKGDELEDEASSENKCILFELINQFEQGNTNVLLQILSTMSTLSKLKSGIPYDSILQTNFVPCLIGLIDNFFQYDFTFQQAILLTISMFIDPNVQYIEEFYTESIFNFNRSCLCDENPKIVELALYYFAKLSERPDESHLINDTGIVADILKFDLLNNPSEQVQNQACRLIIFTLLTSSNTDLIPPLISAAESDNDALCAIAVQGINWFLQKAIQNSEDSEISIDQIINDIIQTDLPIHLLSKMEQTDVEAVVQFSLNFYFTLLNFPKLDNDYLAQLFLSEGGLGPQLMKIFEAPADDIFKERFRLGCGILAGYFERNICIDDIFQSGVLNLLITRIENACIPGKMAIIILFLQIIRLTSNLEIIEQLAATGVLKEIIDLLPTLASAYLNDALQTIYQIFNIWDNAKVFFLENSLSDVLEEITTEDAQSNEIIDNLMSQLNC